MVYGILESGTVYLSAKVYEQGRRQKNFQGEATKKKKPKKNKKLREIALLSLYLIYLYHV